MAASRRLRRASARTLSGTGASAGAMSYHFRTVPSSVIVGSGRDDLLDVDVFGRDAARCLDGAHAAAPTGARSRARVKSMIQFVSHVSPPSSENACSQRGVARRDARPREAHPDRSAAERVVTLEDARVAGEPADHRWVEEPRPPAVRPVDRPQLRLGVVEAEGHARRTRRRSSVQNTSSFPSPPGSGRAATFDSNSSHSSDPARRCASRRLRTSHFPIQKSKSWDVARSFTAAVIVAPPVVEDSP